MKEMILNIITLLFPILMYLVFSYFNKLINKRLVKVAFIITIYTSIYLSMIYNHGDFKLLLFLNIPVLICYFKRDGLLGLITSVVVIILSYNIYSYNILAVIIKYFAYFIIYILLYKKREFTYLFFKLSAVIQGLFISMEYFTNMTYEINKVIDLFIYIAIIYTLTFFSLHLFKMANNIGDLYNVVNKIREDNKLKDALFKLTHEIKNPLAVCKGYLDMIDMDDEVKSKKFIKIIKSEIDRSLNVIADFVDYSKIKINKDILDIDLLIEDVKDSFSLLLIDKNIKLRFINSDEEIYILGDYDRLKQVFVNIIKNSVESIEHNGIIEIEIKLFNKYVLVIVSDNGIGMDKEELSNIKEMFYTTKNNGTGLGVALSNEIIVAHNGTLEYESEKNVGTKCMIKLPIEEY